MKIFERFCHCTASSWAVQCYTDSDGYPLGLLTIQSTTGGGFIPTTPSDDRALLSFILGWKGPPLHRRGVNGREVISTKLPPDAPPISPESNPETLPLSPPLGAKAVVTFAIYSQVLLILSGLHRSPRTTLGSSLYPGVCINRILCALRLDGQKAEDSGWADSLMTPFTVIADGNIKHQSLSLQTLNGTSSSPR